MNFNNIIKKSAFYNILMFFIFLTLIYIFDFFCNIIIFNQFSLYNFLINFIKIELFMVIPITIILMISLIIYYRTILSLLKNKNETNQELNKIIIQKISRFKLIIIIIG